MLDLETFKKLFYKEINKYYSNHVILPRYPMHTQINHALGVFENEAEKKTIANFIASKRNDQKYLLKYINALENIDIYTGFKRNTPHKEQISYASGLFPKMTDEMKEAVVYALKCRFE